MIVTRHDFVKGLSQTLRTSCGVEPGWRLVIAVSGGADSVALLRAVAAIAGRKECRFDPHIAHVQHHLRPEAECEATFVEQLAASLKLPFHRRDITPASDTGTPGATGNLEANARHQRYAALLEVAREVDAEAVVTAHHADDQLETILMRLIRGCSVRGLSGMSVRRRFGERWLLRPMLAVDHAAAVSFLRDVGQSWCEDASNAVLNRQRNRLRAEVLPVLRDMRADAAMKAGESAQLAGQAANIAEHLLRRTANRCVIAVGKAERRIERLTAQRLPDAMLSMLLRDQCLAMGCPADQLTSRQMATMVRTVRDQRGDERRFELAGGVRVLIDRHHARITSLPV
ncbi:MAG: tRNA lysidine(34) synthetase TilS [Phycisphaeraceae bacterium]